MNTKLHSTSSVAVRHHLAGMELLLLPATRSRFAALIVAVVGNMSSWISGNLFRATELLRAVQEN
jgi:hypothetical protein